MKSVTTILFVENDAVALTLYQKRLQREGFHVEVAEDGIAALKVLSEMTPDIVVLDLMLPKFSGRDVFDYMRADANFKEIPVILFSNAPKTDWPSEINSSPTRALPKSEANFAALLELIREMTAAKAAAQPSVPEPEPALVLPAANGTSTAGSMPGVSDENTATQTAGQFLEYAMADLSVLREHCLAFIKSPSTDAGRKNLSALRQRLNVLNSGAQKTGCARLSLLAGAWEALLGEIERKPSIASPSILQTLAQAADCLRILLNNNVVNPMEPLPQARVLSVDDDEICNDVAVSALQSANIGADSVLDANAALEMLTTTNYDLVLLDINMPGLTGFEVCEKLRTLPQHAKTPVIFVTAFNNFENRKQSVLSGGGDLIAKPVAPLELALKVTIHLLKAPPKPVLVPAAEPATALVWKEPAEIISHDTEMFLKGVEKINAAPSLVAATTETQTNNPEKEAITNFAPSLSVPVAANPISEKVLQPAPLIAAGALGELRMKPAEDKAPPASEPVIPQPIESKPVEAKPVESVVESKPAEVIPVEAKAPEPAPAESKPIEPEAEESKPVESKIVESNPKQHPLPETSKVVLTQPARTSEPALPSSNKGSSKEKKPMSKESNPQFNTLVNDVANIIFGDNPPDINLRLVRMALEQVWQNRSELQTLDQIAKEIARIIFGDGAISDLNVRLVKMALERSNSIALFKAA